MLWEHWSNSYAASVPSIFTFLKLLPFLPIPARKVLLKCSRCQLVPGRQDELYWRYQEYWDRRYSFPEAILEKSVTLLQVAESVQAFIQSPISSGFISCVLRAAPSNNTEEMQEIIDGCVVKEMSSMSSHAHSTCLYYEPIFGGGRNISAPLATAIPPNAQVSASIRAQFLSVRRQLENQRSPFFPKTSYKSCGRHTLEEYNVARRWVGLGDVEHVCTTDLERFYHEFGVQIQGSTEMRWAWKFNDLKPRVYYAQGGTAYWPCRFVQRIWNIIIDASPVTHRHNRFLEPAEPLSEDKDCILHDYASFTSNLDEMVCYARQVALYFVGVQIDIVDAWDGIVCIDVGELLLEWIETVGNGHEVDLTRILGLEGFLSEMMVCRNVPLGLGGDIFCCTSLHGIIICYICGSVDSCKCVGDDARVHVDSGMTDQQYNTMIAVLGEASVEKGFRFRRKAVEDETLDTWDYCKRPITRLHDRMLHGDMLIWPSLENFLDLQDDFHRVTNKTFAQRVTKYTMQLSRFMTLLSFRDVSEDDRHVIHFFIKKATRSLFRDGVSGKLEWKKHTDGRMMLMPPIIRLDDIGRPYQEIVCRAFDLDEEVTVREVGYCDDAYIDWTVGESFVHKGSGCISYLTKLGYLEEKSVFTTVTRDQAGDDLFLDLLLCRIPSVYSYSILRIPPEWLVTLAGSV